MKILFLLLAPLFIFSQNIKYSFTNAGFNGNGYKKLTLNEYTKITLDNPYVIFETFDEKLKYRKNTDTAMVFIDAERFTNEGFFFHNSDMHFLYSTGSRSKNNKQLYAIPFKSKSSKTPEKPITLLLTESLNPDVFTKSYSKDGSKVLFVYKLEKNKEGGGKKRDLIGFHLLDSKMNSLYSNELEMPYSKKEMDNLDYKVDSKGNIYILAKVRVCNEVDFPGGDCKIAKDIYRFELIRINKQTNTFEKIKIDMGKMFTNTFQLDEDTDNNIIISGFYAIGYGWTKGSYLIKVEFENNGDFKKTNTIINDFPIDLLKANEKASVLDDIDKQNEKGKLGSKNLFFNETVLNSDGSIVLIGEEYFDDVPANGAATHYCNEIITLKIDKDNKLLWMNKIPKNQVGVRSGDLSYHHHTYKGEDYFFYIDHINNLNLSKTDVPAEHTLGKNGQLACTKIDKNGILTKQIIYNVKDGDVNIYPKNFTSVAENVILYAIEEHNQYSKSFRIDFE